MLDDQDYWNALHRISGQYLSVFYFEKPKFEKVRSNTMRSNCRFMEYMCPIVPSSRPAPLNDFIKSTFKIQNDFKEPYVIFFQTTEGTITNSFLVRLKKEHIEKAFLELKAHIQNAVDSVENVLPENRNNHEGIFSLLENGVKQGQFLTFVKGRIYQPITFATTIGGFIKFFL